MGSDEKLLNGVCVSGILEEFCGVCLESLSVFTGGLEVERFEFDEIV